MGLSGDLNQIIEGCITVNRKSAHIKFNIAFSKKILWNNIDVVILYHERDLIPSTKNRISRL